MKTIVSLAAALALFACGAPPVEEQPSSLQAVQVTRRPRPAPLPDCAADPAAVNGVCVMVGQVCHNGRCIGCPTWPLPAGACDDWRMTCGADPITGCSCGSCAAGQASCVDGRCVWGL